MKQQNKIPTLRFPEFSGEWEEKKIGSLGEFLGGGTPESSNKEYWQGNIAWISSSDIKEGSIHQVDKSRFITEEAIKESATKIIPKKAILMVSRVGIGKFAVADEELCTSQDFTNLVTNEDSYFLAHYFLARANRFIRLSQGTSIKGFTGKDIKNAKFSIPQLPEQQKIAAFLTAVDSKIELLQKKKQGLEQYKKGVMQQIFSQQLRFKDEKGNNYPDWEEKKLGDLFKFKQGVQCGVDKQFEKQSNNMVRFIRIIDLTSTNEPIRYIESVGDEHIIKVDDLFMVRYGTPGFVGYGYEGIIANNLFRLIPKTKVNTKFYYFVFNFLSKKLIGLSNSSTMPALNFSSLGLLKIPIIPLEEQTKIANFLCAIDDKIALVNTQLENTQQFKKGLLQQMFV